MIKLFLLRIMYLALSLLEGMVMTFVLVGIFGQISVIVAGTGFEEYFVKLLSLTPGVGWGKGGNFSLDESHVVTFFLFWGAVWSVISIVIKKVAKKEIVFGLKTYLWFGLSFHVISLIVFTVRFGMGFSLLFIGLLFITYLFGVLFSRVIQFYKEIVGKLAFYR